MCVFIFLFARPPWTLTLTRPMVTWHSSPAYARPPVDPHPDPPYADVAIELGSREDPVDPHPDPSAQYQTMIVPSRSSLATRVE